MKKRFLYLIALCLLCSVVLSACSMPSLPKLPFLNKDNADIASDPVVAVQNTVNMMDLEGVYSWWSYRFKAREKNAGWRIDYFITSSSIDDKLREAKIHTQVTGSDHCPVELDVDL